MFVVSVLVSSTASLDTLVDQHQADAERHGWSHQRVASPSDALAAASGDFLIAWNVYQASADALTSLVAAAIGDPDKRGSLSANWDPAILWRRDEFGGGTGRKCLAQAAGVAFDAGEEDTTLIPR